MESTESKQVKITHVYNTVEFMPYTHQTRALVSCIITISTVTGFRIFVSLENKIGLLWSFYMTEVILWFWNNVRSSQNISELKKNHLLRKQNVLFKVGKHHFSQFRFFIFHKTNFNHLENTLVWNVFSFIVCHVFINVVIDVTHTRKPELIFYLPGLSKTGDSTHGL